MTRYALGHGPRRERAHQWLPDLLSEPVERLAAILDAHFASLDEPKRTAALAAFHAEVEILKPFRGGAVPGLPCTRTKPGGVRSWEEWRKVPAVAGHS